MLFDNFLLLCWR